MKWRSTEIIILALLTVAVVGVYVALYRMVAVRSQPPAPPGVVEVTAPPAGLIASVGDALDARARVAGADVNRLEFWTDDAPLFVSSRSIPAGSDWWAVSGQWSAGWPGLHHLYARAFSAGGIATSQPVTVSIAPAAHIIYASNREGRYALYRARLDGAGLERLSGGAGDSREPALGAANQLFFTQISAGRPRALWQFDLLGRAPRLFLEEAANLSQAAWSPAGGSIAFVSNRSGQEQIWLADADGSNPRRLTDEPTLANHPSWSPDGLRMVYTARRGENWDIYRLGVQGEKPARLTRAPEVDWQPAWSPTAAQIAFVSNRDGAYQIYVMDAEGNNARAITNLAGGVEQPRWSPDGRWLLFVGHSGGGEGLNNRELYLARADGRDLMRLTENAFDDTEPVWLGPAPGVANMAAGAVFTATYYANMTLSGTPAFTRQEARPDFDWGPGGPGGGVPTDHFSARWAGALAVETAGDYLFDVRADDGARLYLDGALLADMWGQRGRGERSAPARLEAGSHTLQLDYYENEGLASVALSWKRVGQ